MSGASPQPVNMPTNSNTQSANSVFEQIKQAIAPFREVCHATLEDIAIPWVSHIVESEAPASSAHAGLPVFTVHPQPAVDNKQSYAKGEDAFPSSTPTPIVEAFSKQNMCDVSVYSFLTRIRTALAPLGAEVEWMFVRTFRQFVVHWEWNPAPSTDINHSVFIITTAHGERFVADFTGEQFGYNPADWFMRAADYMASRAKPRGYRIRLEFEYTNFANICPVGSTGYNLVYKFRSACDKLDWTALQSLPADQCIISVRTQLAAIMQRWQDADTKQLWVEPPS
jgi:hypothetical protein